MPYEEVPEFLNAIREIPNDPTSSAKHHERTANQPKAWVMKSARIEKGSFQDSDIRGACQQSHENDGMNGMSEGLTSYGLQHRCDMTMEVAGV